MNRPELMMEIASLIKTRSTCARLQVGVVITNPEMTRILSYGYNGNYRGGPNICDDSSREGDCGCIHAEVNALLKAPYDPHNLILFTTHTPCLSCAKVILNAEIHTVYYGSEFRSLAGLHLLMECDVYCRPVENPYAA